MPRQTASFVVVTTTVDSEKAAAELARQIVESRLAACVQRLPITSNYWWKGKLETTPEILLLAKTRRSLAARLTRFIRRHHAYEVPEITVTPIVGGWTDYLQWIATETAAPAKSR
jgi:periplasmic divalent cation tolerance protein